MKIAFTIALAASALLPLGCDANRQSVRRLHLPPGSAENGKVAFVDLKCTECHTVAGVELPLPTAKPESVVMLGGEVTRMRTVGDLLTSIIHPSYSISEKMKPTTPKPAKSPMRPVNDVMTVAQMIDLVAFLQPRYHAMPPAEEYYYLP